MEISKSLDEDRNGGSAFRLDAFVDATFAFVVTLLVISVGDLPASLDALRTALWRVPAFAGSLVLIAMV